MKQEELLNYLLVTEHEESGDDIYTIIEDILNNVLSYEVTEIRAVGDNQIPENFNAIIKE